MHRFIPFMLVAGLLVGCSGTDVASPPLLVADEHRHFANCAAFVQKVADDHRAASLEQCLARNADLRQVATRL